MFSYLQSKFTIPLFLDARQNLLLSTQLNELFSKNEHVSITGENIVDLKRQVLDWTKTISVPLVWLQLDSLDVDPGRFWTVLVYGLRRHYPTLGQSLLAGIMDHHASPNPQVFHQFRKELVGKPFVLVINDSYLIQKSSVWKQILSLLDAFREESMLIFLDDKNKSLLEDDIKNLSSLTVKTDKKLSFENFKLPSYRNLLSIFDIWWLSWLKRTDILQDMNLVDALIAVGQIDFLSDSAIKPTLAARTWLREPSITIDYEAMVKNIRDMASWLVSQGEWLDAYRWFLFIRDFETACELLESQALPWLNNNGDALTLLFWLRELPSVLLSSRPLPAYLAAESTFRLGLNTQSRFYLTNVENNLEAMTRFSRSNPQQTDFQVTDGGLTFQQMVRMVHVMKQKI
ncbi:MAG: hypothetical protein CL609_18825 [Anaerolineaceae bacterium]|nr:hypothetical protein [Anaerolineaceae bacterium]